MKPDTELSAIEAARRLGIDLDYLYRLLWSGRLLGTKDGRRWKIPLSAVEDRIKQVAS